MALVQLVIAWPLYDLLSRYPEFFVARQAEPGDIVFLILSLSLLFPLLLVGLQSLAFRIHAKVGVTIYGLIIFVLLLLLGHLMANKFSTGSFVSAWAVFFAIGLFVIYIRTQAGQLFLNFLSPAILIVPLLFLSNAAIRPLLLPPQTGSTQSTASSGTMAPVLFVVFDEFPSNVLLTADGLIDDSRFPNFSTLSKHAYWYPNATTVATSTVLAIPAILTGRYPDTYRMPHQGEFPDNLFTWLGTDYDLNVQEAVSAMCPASLCGTERLPPLRSRWQAMMQDISAIYLNLTAKQLFPDLPAVNQSWEGFWGEAIQGGKMYEHRLQQLDAFVDKIQMTQKPGLDFLHINFPHIPYEYLPSGKRYNDGWLMPGLDFTINTWVGTDLQSRQAYARFEMQVGAADTWLGQLLEKLKDEGLYERSLIILTADHGVSFEPGSGRRDAPPEGNLDTNILPVPLIIKVPNQSNGLRDTRNAEVIDILPTVAQVLQRQLSWETDGVSLLGDPKSPEKHAVHKGETMTRYSTSLERVEEALSAAWTSHARKAPGSHLIGQSLAKFEPGYDPDLQVSLNHAEFFDKLSASDDFIPAHANGELLWPGHPAADLVFVLNGSIVEVSSAYDEKGTWKFSAMLPASKFTTGKNTIEVLGLISNENGPELVRGAVSSDQPGYSWDAEIAAVHDSQGVLIADSEGIAGGIDYISRGVDSVEVFGWGIDAAQSRSLDAVLIFDGNKLVWQGTTYMLREETHAFGVVIEVGFSAVIPLGRLVDRDADSLRIYAVSNDRRFREIPLEQNQMDMISGKHGDLQPGRPNEQQ